MKKINALMPVFFLSLLAMQPAFSQDFPGYSTGNYTGVNSVFSNPAGIADSRYRWDFNLFGINMLLGNNRASLTNKDFSHFDGDTIKERFLSGKEGPVNGIISAAVNGPSFFVNIDKKSAVAFTTRSRLLVNLVDIDSKLANQLMEDGSDDLAFPYSISSSRNQIVNLHAYTELGLSYARVFYNKEGNFLKAGMTLKYLAGTANGSISISNLNATVDEDNTGDNAWLTDSRGRISMGLGGIQLSDMEPGDLLSFKSNGFGGDIGFVYEHRSEAPENRRDLNKYNFRVGLALLDVGGITYTRDGERSGAYDIHIPKGQRFYLSSLSDAEIDHIKDTLAKYPQFFTEDSNFSSGSYRVSLPTTLRLDADYHIHNGFYVNATARVALARARKNMANSGLFNSLSVTPRYENRKAGLFLPVSYGSLTGFAMGVALRLGPLYAGSGSLLSATLGHTKQVDGFVGFHFGSLEKNREKKRNHKRKEQPAIPVPQL